MRNLIYKFLMLFISACQPGGEKPDIAHTTGIHERVYYDFSDNIRKRYDSTRNFHDAAVQFAEIGKHFEAIKIYDQGAETFPKSPVTFDASLYVTMPAVDYIVSEAAKNQIVIINEEHHVSTHRFFTMQLLKGLFEAGYRYFGAETINLWDTLLNQRKYPTLNTGYYTAEPQYGNLVREAMQTGYFVFAYEASGGKNGMPREIEQARNIEKILTTDPAARILIHCGYGHIIEGDVESWGKAMAGRLREFTGIDPLTIDQVELTEHSDSKYENPYYQKMQYEDFVVLINSGNVIPLNFRPGGSPSDIFVYHPRTKLKYNRPDWLFKVYKPHFVADQINIGFPVLVKAYIAGEDSMAVPADVIEILSKSDSTALVLKPDLSYRIVIENKQKEKQEFFIGGTRIFQPQKVK